MRLTKKRVEEAISYACGNDVLPLVARLSSSANVSEFDLANKLEEDIKRVRNMLYRLYEWNLVSFTRKKDKKKGWYIYYWNFNAEHVKYLYEKMKKETLEKLEEKLKQEHEISYLCPNSCARINFDQAFNFEYKCPECGELVEQEEQGAHIEHLKQKISEIRKDMK